MKTTNTSLRFWLTVLLAGSLSGLAVAQKSDKPATRSRGNQLHLRVTERNGDDVRDIERTYSLEGMTDERRDQLVNKLVDSLRTARKDGKRSQLTITIDDDGPGSDRLTYRERRLPNLNRKNKGNQGDTDIFFFDDNDRKEWQRDFDKSMNELGDRMSRMKFKFDDRNYSFKMDSVADRLNRLQFDFKMPKDWDRKLVAPFEDWSRQLHSKPSSIRSLDAYPNNPEQDQLNIRFTAPTKGDVAIVVTNAKGKEIARKEVKDFTGDYVGQVDLGKKVTGTYFVTVTQNDDGSVKRVVIE